MTSAPSPNGWIEKKPTQGAAHALAERPFLTGCGYELHGRGTDAQRPSATRFSPPVFRTDVQCVTLAPRTCCSTHASTCPLNPDPWLNKAC